MSPPPVTDPRKGQGPPGAPLAIQAAPANSLLDEQIWRATATDHATRVEALTAAHRSRCGIGSPHPVEDFLFTYYSLRPSQLRRWYPGAGIGLAGAGERLGWRFHRLQDGFVFADIPALMAARGEQIQFVGTLLAATAGRQGQFGCFGLHEWAMVYQQPPQQRRHAEWRLRLGADGTDDVVRQHQIRCSHYDAFRFFTAPARPRHVWQLELRDRQAREQPGCLHSGMDLYKWAYKLIPAIPSELLLDCFLLARTIREVDMRASPYDLRELGYPPIEIETPSGKAEYVAAQRELADRASPLRARLLSLTNQLTDCTAC